MSAFANDPKVLERLDFHMKESSTALETKERKDNDEAEAVQIDSSWIKMKVRPKRDMLYKIIRADHGLKDGKRINWQIVTDQDWWPQGQTTILHNLKNEDLDNTILGYLKDYAQANIEDINEEAFSILETPELGHDDGLLKECRLMLQYKDQYQGNDCLHKNLIAHWYGFIPFISFLFPNFYSARSFLWSSKAAVYNFKYSLLC